MIFAGTVVQTHELKFDPCDVVVTVSDEGSVWVELKGPGPDNSIGMDWDDFREILDFVCVHGLAMKNPCVVEYENVKEGQPTITVEDLQ